MGLYIIFKILEKIQEDTLKRLVASVPKFNMFFISLWMQSCFITIPEYTTLPYFQRIISS